MSNSIAPKERNIFFVGSHAVGKSTLARWTANLTGRPLITEVSRKVWAEMERPLAEIRVHLEESAEFQHKVLLRQIEEEKQQERPYVSDRSICCLAYTAQHTLDFRREIKSSVLEDYAQQLRNNSIIFFVRPSEATLKEDGVRAEVSMREVLQIDAMVKLLLEGYNLDYIDISSTNMQERARTIQSVLKYAGNY